MAGSRGGNRNDSAMSLGWRDLQPRSGQLRCEGSQTTSNTELLRDWSAASRNCSRSMMWSWLAAVPASSSREWAQPEKMQDIINSGLRPTCAPHVTRRAPSSSRRTTPGKCPRWAVCPGAAEWQRWPAARRSRRRRLWRGNCECIRHPRGRRIHKSSVMPVSDQGAENDRVALIDHQGWTSCSPSRRSSSVSAYSSLACSKSTKNCRLRRANTSQPTSRLLSTTTCT